MAREIPPKKPAPGSIVQNPVSYAYKPSRIGAVIQEHITRLNISVQTVAEFMDVTERTVNRWYTRAYLSFPQVLRLSELLQVNLLLEYHPNVKPLPNPLQADLDKNKGYAEDREELVNQVGIL